MNKRVEICGNIASGKTTLCQGLAKKEFQPLYEEFQKNPFFEDFYIDPAAYSFETEVTFLLQHYHSIKKQKASPQLATDYSFLLDMAYADVNLSGSRLNIFFEILQELQLELGLPSRIIHLICPDEVLLKRIIKRSRDAETTITIDYLNSLSRAISLRVKQFSTQIPTLTIDSNAIDFTSGLDGITALETILV